MFRNVKESIKLKERKSRSTNNNTPYKQLINRISNKNSNYNPVTTSKQCGNCIFFNEKDLYCHHLYQTMYDNSYACSSHTSTDE